ncbi:MAG TPA: methionine--tRNA ligase [Phycisphaerae bacterium]|nr:methionine--tRNA ligase [Phycisphaerae bacterium]
MAQKRNILVTSALPYANGAIHIGHLVEYIQTDIWVRFQRLRGHRVVYLCGDDAHGTPVMLRARSEGLEPEQFIARMNQEHRADFARFGVEFDDYYSTHSPENRELSYRFYERLNKGGYITTRDVEQFYDPVEKIFLPDRFIRGTCPNCKSPDQYGDSCEVCGKHYSPTELIEPRSVVSGAKPERRSSLHFFLRLESFRTHLLELLDRGLTDQTTANKLREWFTDELKDWDISRDAPFFGFPIPDQPGKFFYNWLDAPIGYLAALAHLLGTGAQGAEDFWQMPDLEINHFIGKDIIYFHALFWPAMLSGAGLRPPSHLFVHGFLTVNGEKMSKSRGTFLNAADFARHLDPLWLRYYYATRLTGSPADLDLNFEDFAARINSELVGKLANLISRAAPMLSRQLDGQTGIATVDALGVLNEIRAAEKSIVEAYEHRNFAAATRQICALADKANKFVEDQAPWSLIKDDPEAARGVLTAALDCGRMLAIYLKPIVPALVEKIEKCLNLGPLSWNDIQSSMPAHRINPFEHLVSRVQEKEVQQMLDENKKEPASQASAAIPALGTAPDAEPLAPVCTFEQFTAVDLRVARVVKAEVVEQSDKLIRLELDAGALGKRTVLAGIKNAYTPEELQGRLVIFCANLAPRKMKFGVSEGMILAAGPGGKEIFILDIDQRAKPGERVH